ncbi:MAG TPA: ATP-binding protein [Sulfuricurvum sp.]|nr:ATP-binding protein [Sulfuricurvum sp.]
MKQWLRRRSVYFTIAYVLLTAVAVFLLYSRYATLTKTYTQTHIHEFDQRIDSYQLMQQKMMDNYYGMFLNSPQIAEILHQAAHSDPVIQGVLRRELYGRMEEVFFSLRGFDIRLMLFHLPKQIAFLRVHEPEKFGDSLTLSRPSVVKVQREQKKISTFETGKFFDGFRTLYPLFHKGDFAGSVEIAYPFLALKNQALHQSPGAYTLLVKRSIQESKSAPSDLVKYYQGSVLGAEYLEDKESALEKGLTGFTKNELDTLLGENKIIIENALKQGILQGIKLHYNDKYALIVLKPIHEIGGEHAGYMVEVTPNHTFFADQFNQLIELSIIIALLLALLMWYVYRYQHSNLLLEQYKNAIDQSLIISKTDRRGIITYVNGRFIETNGYTEEELIGKPHSIIRHPDTPASVFKEMFATISQGKIFTVSLKNRTKDNESYYVNLSVCPIVDENGAILEYIGICEDITKIQNSLLKAKEAEQIKSLFIANMSHEIRTPLNGIVGFVQLLAKSSLDAKQRRYLEIVQNSIDTLTHIVNDILDFSKIEEGKIEIELIELDPTDQFDAVFSLFMSQAEDKKIEYRLALDPRMHECLKLDIFRVKQVLSNLISNALKFTPQGGTVDVAIEVEKDTAAYQTLLFSVIDTGIGIPLEKQDKVFEKFTQADSSTTRQFGGTGLGLSISYAMVGLMGGLLEVVSEEGKGSKFSFRLKAAKCKRSKKLSLLHDANSTTMEQKALRLNVLVAEDYDINQMLIDELLRHNYGIEADFANNGEIAVEMVREKKYDLIFMDANMPVMDGIEATRIIRQNHPDLPIIALTANAFEGDRDKFIQAGMNDYLSKPLDPNALHKVLIGYILSKDISAPSDKSGLGKMDALYFEVKERLSLSDETFIRLNDKFFQSGQMTLEKLKAAIIAENYKEIEMYAHSLKGSSTTLYYTILSDIAASIENHARETKNYPYMEVLTQLESEFTTTEEAYRIWKNRIGEQKVN